MVFTEMSSAFKSWVIIFKHVATRGFFFLIVRPLVSYQPIWTTQGLRSKCEKLWCPCAVKH